MHILVLGSSAGGGFPQWNCNCPNCSGYRHGTVPARVRTQSSIAVSADGSDWVLINASPDLTRQIQMNPPLHPRGEIRHTPIRAVIVVDSQIDHVTGLLSLREGGPLQVYCTEMVEQDLRTGFPVLEMLAHFKGVTHHRVPIDGSEFAIAGFESLAFTAYPLLSKAPPYSPHRHDPQPGDNIGLRIVDRTSGKTLFYAPGLGVVEPHLVSPMSTADLVLVDGTMWNDDEMIRLGIGDKKGSEMGHLPLSGPEGMVAFLDTLEHPRKVLIHINNTNPVLDDDSQERAELINHGIEISFDGMRLEI